MNHHRVCNVFVALAVFGIGVAGAASVYAGFLCHGINCP